MTNAVFKVPASIFEQVKDDPGFSIEFITEVKRTARMNLREGLMWLLQEIDHTRNIHINLYHVNMGAFDYAKLAIMSEDTNYVGEIRKASPKYVKPILRAIYESRVIGRRPDLSFLNLNGWDARRVMFELSAMIPLADNMAIDFGPIITPSPHIAFRVIGKPIYEDVAKMVIRYGGLVKLACDPEMYTTEYMNKVNSIIGESPVADPMPKIWVFLLPIMSRVTRNALNQILMHMNSGSRIPEGSFKFLSILRSAIDMNQVHNNRVRQGLTMLLGAMGLNTQDLLMALNQTNTLRQYGITRTSEPFVHTQAMLVNTIKTLHMPSSPRVLVQSMIERERTKQNLIAEQQKKLHKQRELVEQLLRKKKKEKWNEEEAERVARLRAKANADEEQPRRRSQ